MVSIDHDSNFLMVTGVARSGTTLIAECLNHHPEIVCVSDPMNELFRAFHHYAYYKVHGVLKDPLYPMDHFFFSGSRAVRRFLEATDMKQPIPQELRERVLERIAARGGRFCPEIKGKVEHCRAKTFDGLFLEMMKLLFEAYGKERCKYLGFKDAWCEHLILPLSKTFPKMKFINMLRDPRAVVSSNYHSTSCYPVAFNARDWRKSVYHTWRYQQGNALSSDRFLAVRYEDLIEAPENQLRRISRFMNLTFDPAMLHGEFKAPNTSYDKTKFQTKGITGAFKEKWKDRLPLHLRIKVEVLCEPEMKTLGYGDPIRMNPVAKLFSALIGGEVEYEKLGNWCKKLVPAKLVYQSFWKWVQYFLEVIRSLLYRLRIGSSSVLETFFYERDYYEWMTKGGHFANGFNE